MEPIIKNIGYVSACIGGDERYRQYLEVCIVIPEDGHPPRTVIRLHESNPVGGMDGPGFSEGKYIVNRSCISSKGLKDLSRYTVQMVKSILDNEGDTIKRYGKPTKTFRWSPTGTKGLSVTSCLEALQANVKGDDESEGDDE